MFKSILTLLTFIILINVKGYCQNDEDLINLYNLMQGSFSSEEQSSRDSSFHNISIHIYPIWKENGLWLYVEQALFTEQDKPYRQRIYEIKRENDSLFSSNVYTIPNATDWIGKWKIPEAFNKLSPDFLQQRSGCTVYLRKIKKNHFKGSTNEMDCPSDLRGASYATSEVEIFKDKFISWDRGFDVEKKQVWGSVKEGYIFYSLNNFNTIPNVD